MPRLIDADKLKDIISDTWVLDRIDEQPTVDAVEVVRCKDCKWCHAGYCEKADDIILFGFPQHEWENFYCAWGERREDAKIN